LRDFVLGATLMNARGELLRFGGKVMKNVAGYDVSRLLAGSLGTLGLIAEVSLKVLPQPATEVTLSFALDQASALRKLNEWGGQPLPISASAWRRDTLDVRLSGAPAAIDAARTRLSADVRATQIEAAQASRFWRGIREHTDPYFGGALPLWRLSLPATAAPLALAGEQLIEWGGALRWLRSDADAAGIRTAAARAGGQATLFRASDKSAGAFHPLAPALFNIHRALKAEFDPAGIFNPGRMYDF
jgi:glycolate oxidase FAD binding subunit